MRCLPSRRTSPWTRSFSDSWTVLASWPARGSPRSGSPTARAASAGSWSSGMSDELDRSDGSAAPHPRPARRDARGKRPVPDRRHPWPSPLSRLVARRHPDMRSFLGVPIVARGTIIGAFYLTEKERGRPPLRRAQDQELIELLAAHAAIAITNARLYEQQPRAVDPLRAQSTRARAPRRRQPEAVQPDARPPRRPRRSSIATSPPRGRRSSACASSRARLSTSSASLILGLRPPELERDGLEGALRKEIEMLRRRTRRRRAPDRVEDAIEKRRARAGTCCGSRTRRSTTRSVTRAADHVTVRVGGAGGAPVVEVADDGIGFEPAAADLRSMHLGLTSMEERARELGGRLEIRSAPGAGTTVRSGGRRTDA